MKSNEEFCKKLRQVNATIGLKVRGRIPPGDPPFFRFAVFGDGPAIHRAHMESIQKICSQDHTPEEVAAWGGRPYREDQRHEAITNDLVWVVEWSGVVEGYVHLKITPHRHDGHFHGLYFTPRVKGLGLGRAAMELVMEVARLSGTTRLTLGSTLTALNFYKHMGFRADGEMKTMPINGTPIRYWPMALDISAA